MKAHPHRHLTFHDLTIERMGSSKASGDEGVKKRLGSGPPFVRIAAGEGDEEEARKWTADCEDCSSGRRGDGWMRHAVNQP